MTHHMFRDAPHVQGRTTWQGHVMMHHMR